MMISRIEFSAYMDALLEPNRFKDYCPNGLQVAGCEQIKTLVTGVTASQALIDAAIGLGADTILVHHGYFWRGEDPCIVGIKQRRLKQLLLNDINLIAYHLPLDAHATLGNNVQLARLLSLKIEGTVPNTGEPNLALFGQLELAQTGDELAKTITRVLGRTPLFIQGHDRVNSTIAWCSGSAQSYIEQAAALGVDVFISGEISEQTVHLARELGINYIAAGHHATERYGVQALGEHLAEKFALNHTFVDIDNPV